MSSGPDATRDGSRASERSQRRWDGEDAVAVAARPMAHCLKGDGVGLTVARP